MTDITVALRAVFGPRLKENEPLAKYVNFRIGGPARWVVEAKTEGEIVEALRIAKDAGVPTFILGGGSNTLPSDQGFDGLVVKIALRSFSITPSSQEGAGGSLVRADAGAMSAGLARATAEAGLAGLEWMISLPGTVGGAVRGNAGCFGGEVKDNLVSARILRGGQITDVSAADCAFGYRDSAFKRTDDVILSATFALSPGIPTVLKAKMEEQLAKRKASQPTNAGSAGCVFKNPPGQSAGRLVDEAALKGQTIGDAEISTAHGNFIVNKGHATADQVVQLVALAKTRVRDRFGIQLQEEIQYLGFGS